MKNITILASSKVNDIEVLENQKNKIDEFLKEHISDNDIVTIGKMKNINLIKYLECRNYEVTVKTQPKDIIIQHNKSMIKSSDITLFLNYNSSENMQRFIEYAQSLEDKEYYILDVKITN